MTRTTVEPGSLILVTGATGYVGSGICKFLLQSGYRVRAAARSLQKGQPLQERFDREFGHGQFELVHVADYAVEGAYDEALRGAQGFVIVAGDTSTSTDVDAVLKSSVAAMQHMLESASRAPTVRRVVMTSSRDASFYGKEDASYTVDASVWNDEIVQKAKTTPADDPWKGMYGYSAGKVVAERAGFAFVAEHHPHFIFNSVLPELVFGERQNPHNKACTAWWMTELFEGSPDNILPFFYNSTYIVSIEDVARIHLAALIEEDVKNERLWAASVPASINQVLAVFRSKFPEKTFPADYSEGVYRKPTGIRIDLRRSRELLKRQGRQDFIGLEETLMDNIKSE